MSDHAEFVFDELVWYVGTSIDAHMKRYAETPKSSGKKTTYRSPAEIRKRYRDILDIGESDDDAELLW